MMAVDNRLWQIKAEADGVHPSTEITPYLAGHGMEVEPVYFLPSNPINQFCLEGRCLQVYHIKQDNVGQPVEEQMADVLRNQVMMVDPVKEGSMHQPDRVERSVGWRLPFPQFSWADASVGTAKRILGVIGDNIYNLVNPPKPE